MPKLNLHRSIIINAPIQKVFDTISDFSTWDAWSPWLIAEEDAKVTIADDNKYYEWEGELVGAGNMQIESELPNNLLSIDLQFLKPFKSSAKTELSLRDTGNGIEVQWNMDSKLPFSLFFMKKMMTNMIGLDYERGLTMLKEYIEEGKVHCKLEEIGDTSIEIPKYIGVQSTCTFEEMKTKMGTDFEALMAVCNSESIVKGFSIYHKWDFKNLVTQYTAAFEVKEFPKDLPENFTTGSVAKTKTFAMEMTGPYHHLGNVWAAIMLRERCKKFKQNKKIDPIEVYINNPNDVKPEELKSQVHLGRK